MEVNPEVVGIGVGPEDTTAMPSDQPGAAPGELIVRPSDALMEPIVVANSLWASTDPSAYDGGRPTEITHLREVELA